jgi:NADH-quinone oxidoreductase subunit L
MAIPSAIIGWLGFHAFVSDAILDGSVFNISWYVSHIQSELVTPIDMIKDSFTELPVYFALAGIVIAWVFHKKPNLGTSLIKAFHPIYVLLDRKYFMDDLYINFLAPIGRGIGRFLWNIGDIVLIDGLIVNGSARLVGWYSRVFRRLQSGYVNSYATFMVVGIILLLTFCTRLIFS